MTAFDRLDRIAGRSIDWLNASLFTLHPMTSDANARRRPDLDRPQVTGKGVFDDRPSEAGIQLGRKRSFGSSENDTGMLRMGRSLQLSVDRTRYFTDAASMPRQGDQVEIGDRRLEVTSAQPDGMSRVVLKLAEIGRST